MSDTYTNACYFGRHNDCHDVNANCCECSCHLGAPPAKSPYQRNLDECERIDRERQDALARVRRHANDWLDTEKRLA
jgi:hypothetical protein